MKTGNAETAVLILNNLGIVYYYQANIRGVRTYESAMQYVEKSSATMVRDLAALTLLNLATLTSVWETTKGRSRSITTFWISRSHFPARSGPI